MGIQVGKKGRVTYISSEGETNETKKAKRRKRVKTRS